MLRASHCLLILVLAAVVGAGGTTRVSTQAAPMPPLARVKAADKVVSQAVPFDLADVRLLDGPFRDAMRRDQQYLLELDPDRLLHNFRVTAGLPSSAQPLGGWEAPTVELRGHSLGHFLSGLALMYRSTGDERFKTKADAIVAELVKIQQAESTKFHPGYLSAYPESFIDRVEARQQVWAPYYTLHKIMAGLLDVHMLCGNSQALDVLVKMADWVKLRQDRLTPEQQQRMLQAEFGGMGEVLANLYALTGNPDHLRLARTFDHAVLFEPLARGEDPLNGLHGNTQIPKMIAAAREYELTGEKRYRDIAGFFWERVAKHRSYVIGGNTDGEEFFPPEEFSRHLGAESTETCNTYNMLKLTRHLFSWAPSAETMDFYERGLFNHILASQDPASGMMCYYVPLKPAAFKTYNTPTESFWCCTGTGMENHAKYGDTIYFHDNTSVYVNLFIASELTWKDKGLVLRQETNFPAADTTRLTVAGLTRPTRLAIKVRYPGWAQRGMSLTVHGNGTPRVIDTSAAKPGSYITIDREWRAGDVVDVFVAMSVRTEAMPDDPRTIALLYGPIVLAGDLGREGMQDVKRFGPYAPQLDRIRTPEIPVFVANDMKDVLAAVKPTSDLGPRTSDLGPRTSDELTFQTSGIGRPRDVSLMPFYRASDIRYTVYWKLYSPGEWETHKSDTAAAESKRQVTERRTVDAVIVHEATSEKDHAFAGEKTAEGFFEGRRFRTTTAGGWISYELKASDKPLKIVCTWRGAEGNRPTFDLLVDGQKVATEALGYHPTGTLDTEYVLPAALTANKSKITVKFQAQPGSTVGALLDVRTVWADLQE